MPDRPSFRRDAAAGASGFAAAPAGDNPPVRRQDWELAEAAVVVLFGITSAAVTVAVDSGGDSAEHRAEPAA